MKLTITVVALKIAKGLHRNKWYRIEEVILCAGKAPNAGIAGATARLGNAASVQKNDSKWSVYFWASPKEQKKGEEENAVPTHDLIFYCLLSEQQLSLGQNDA